MPPAALAVAAATFIPACALSSRSEPPPAIDGEPLTLAQLDVTEGALGEPSPGHMELRDAKVRAVAEVGGRDAAELDFAYLGPTSDVALLSSGEAREQVGLKLRAENACNLVYVMWRIAPTPELVVSVKRNPGEDASSQCGANGYTDVASEWSTSVPALAPGDRHALVASIVDERLTVLVDGRVVWEGPLPEGARGLGGAVGLRADNAKADLQLVPIVPGSVRGEWGGPLRR